MAHTEVVRRNMALDQWFRININEYEKLIVKSVSPTGNWTVREGEYFPENYKWHGPSRSIDHGERWGGPDVTALFEGSVVIPPELEGQDVYFQMLTPTEVIVSSGDKMLAGLDPNRMRFLLSAGAAAGESFSIRMEAYTRSKPDDDRNPRAAALRGCIQRFSKPVLVTIDKRAESLYFDLEVLFLSAFGNAISEDVKDYLRKKCSELLKLMPHLNCSDEQRRDSIERLKSFMEQQVYGADHPFAKEGRLACVSHSHLDIAYFWRAKQTVQKNARTVLIQLNLMDRYADFSYAHSQAWTYEMLEQYYPDLFERVKKKIAEGRWEIVGAMYVEPDCNVVSAESLIRQVQLGKKYFSDRFGVDVKNCWLPDVFGNSAILPQILKKSGVPYFVSNKMSTWNDTNRFPHNHFHWVGHDGSQVQACVPPVHFINWMDPNQAAEHWDALQDKDMVKESLHMYGYGDGGSGASDEMLEFYYRQQKLPGIPEQRLTSAREFLKRNFKDSQELPLWKGDLYLEMHRGTFTNKGILKKMNRQGEIALKETETLCTIAGFSGQSYPSEKLERLWKILLVNQFHDILPGTHVNTVTKDSLKDYNELFKELEKIKTSAVNAMTKEDKNQAWIFNSECHTRSGLALSETPLLSSHPHQKQISPEGIERTVVQVDSVKPYSSISIPKAETVFTDETELAEGLSVSKNVLESPYFKILFDKKGDIKEILDKKTDRKLGVPGKKLNEWQLFEDSPGRYNAWDILERFEDRPLDCGTWKNPSIVERGPLSAAIRWERGFGSSRAVQIVRVFLRENRIDFETFVDWQEREKLLKVSFPLDLNAPVYSCDNSAGVTTYENHRNTSWQKARFEVPCHKWVNLSEGLFGVALLNDCKYGVDVKDGNVRLSLLRGSIRPDMYSDLGQHCFTYSLTTHDGQWQHSRLMNHSLELNSPMKVYDNRTSADGRKSLIEIHPEGRLSALALKEAEDGSGDSILRAVEYTGTSGILDLKLDSSIKQVFKTNLIEKNEEALPIDGRKTRLPVRANEIITLKLCSRN